MTTTPQGHVESLDLSDVIDAATAGQPGPFVTIHLPSDPTGATIDVVRRTFDAQLKDAAAQLSANGASDAEVAAILDPVREDVSDEIFWRQQSRSLTVFCADGFHRIIRVPVELTESVTVAELPHLSPLVPVVEASGRCYVLALAKGKVRLFEADRNAIAELPLGAIPEKFDDVVEAPERELQGRSTGQDSVAFHGHADTANGLTGEFLRAVSDGVEKELGTARSQPLVLATVEENGPAFRTLCSYPAIATEVIAGNPEHTGANELRSAAWQILDAARTEEEPGVRDNILTEVHRGRGSNDLAEIARVAGEGRIADLYVPRDLSVLHTPDASSLLDRALVETMRTKGGVHTLGVLEAPEEALATLRG